MTTRSGNAPARGVEVAMETWSMWVLGVFFVALPFVLMAVFNGADEADSRGRRISRRWRS
ncbi:MAG: hypothetical protein H0V05_01925 [Euzebyaceae bacterium]|jgi:hypothetical protein|nr:hypothetical protein [Euzebyaceae bacterium]